MSNESASVTPKLQRGTSIQEFKDLVKVNFWEYNFGNWLFNDYVHDKAFNIAQCTMHIPV